MHHTLMDINGGSMDRSGSPKQSILGMWKKTFALMYAFAMFYIEFGYRNSHLYVDSKIFV